MYVYRYEEHREDNNLFMLAIKDAHSKYDFKSERALREAYRRFWNTDTTGALRYLED